MNLQIKNGFPLILSETLLQMQLTPYREGNQQPTFLSPEMAGGYSSSEHVFD